MNPLEIERDGDVLTLTLSRPDRRNAIDPEMRDGLIAMLEKAAESARCVVIRGAGPAFCAGADLVALPSKPGLPTMEHMRRSSQALIRAVIDCPVPIIAVVHGACAGLGFSLALVADICIAADDARFMASFTQRALVPDGAIAMSLLESAGLARTRLLLLSGGELSGRQAAEWGVIAASVPAAELDEAARQHIQHIAAMPTKTLAAAKDLIRSVAFGSLDNFMLAERAAAAAVKTSSDSHEGVRAFIEKRPAKYRNE